MRRGLLRRVQVIVIKLIMRFKGFYVLAHINIWIGWSIAASVLSSLPYWSWFSENSNTFNITGHEITSQLLCLLCVFLSWSWFVWCVLVPLPCIWQYGGVKVVMSLAGPPRAAPMRGLSWQCSGRLTNLPEDVKNHSVNAVTKALLESQLSHTLRRCSSMLSWRSYTIMN